MNKIYLKEDNRETEYIYIYILSPLKYKNYRKKSRIVFCLFLFLYVVTKGP